MTIAFDIDGMLSDYYEISLFFKTPEKVLAIPLKVVISEFRFQLLWRYKFPHPKQYLPDLTYTFLSWKHRYLR